MPVSAGAGTAGWPPVAPRVEKSTPAASTAVNTTKPASKSNALASSIFRSRNAAANVSQKPQPEKETCHVHGIGFGAGEREQRERLITLISVAQRRSTAARPPARAGRSWTAPAAPDWLS